MNIFKLLKYIIKKQHSCFRACCIKNTTVLFLESLVTRIAFGRRAVLWHYKI